MNKIRATAATVGLAMLAGTAWFYRRADGKELPQFRTTPVVRTSLKSTVSATGTLSAVRTVQVGTQASGQVSKIYVDFNDKVKQGELLARIDPTLQEQAVEDAQAQLEKAQAQLTQAQDDYTRNKQMLDARVITPQEFETVQSTFSVQQATVKSAQIALDRAKQNLSYTNIDAPIDGVIVERDVDVGQTVAASLSAPQLFLIANDMSEMQILASVDESDIGQIKEGQPVQFTVQSYAGQTFTGTVKQVRLQSTTTDNVVNYTAVISVKNPDGKLLPGMTATVQFLTASATNVLAVPNAALRVKPTDQMLAEVGLSSATTNPSVPTAGATAAKASGGTPTATTGTNAGPAAGASTSAAGTPAGVRTGYTRRAGSAGATSAATLWSVDSIGTLHVTKVRTGLSDGTKTVVTGQGLTEGMQVITSVITDPSTAQAAAPAAAPAKSPFQSQGGRGPRGGF
jgi:HlyD family secretion protein